MRAVVMQDGKLRVDELAGPDVGAFLRQANRMGRFPGV